MKTLILSLTMLASTSAFAADIVSLDCSGRSNTLGNVTLKVKSFFGSEKEATMKDVTMVADGDSVATGRIGSIQNDAKYNPRKYKKHFRFDMTKLVDTKTFNSFSPGDECSVSVMIPQNLLSSNKSRVDVPVEMNCDQNGGAMTLDCSVGVVR